MFPVLLALVLALFGSMSGSSRPVLLSLAVTPPLALTGRAPWDGLCAGHAARLERARTPRWHAP